jgi:hypothetical protein
MVDDNMDEDHVPLLENQRDLLCANDGDYMGSVHGGLGLGMSLVCLNKSKIIDPSLTRRI